MINPELIDYETCHRYARERCFKLNIPKCDWFDIGSDAFLLSIRRAGRAQADSNPAALANRLMFTAVIDTIRQRNYRRNLIHLDSQPVIEPDENDDNPDDEPLPAGIIIGDRGRGAERIRAFEDDWQDPLWLRLFQNERRQFSREGRKIELRVIREGLKDSRLWAVKEKLKISGKKFGTILNFFQVRFALCFQALRAYRSHFDQTCFSLRQSSISLRRG